MLKVEEGLDRMGKVRCGELETEGNECSREGHWEEKYDRELKRYTQEGKKANRACEEIRSVWEEYTMERKQIINCSETERTRQNCNRGKQSTASCLVFSAPSPTSSVSAHRLCSVSSAGTQLTSAPQLYSSFPIPPAPWLPIAFHTLYTILTQSNHCGASRILKQAVQILGDTLHYDTEDYTL